MTFVNREARTPGAVIVIQNGQNADQVGTHDAAVSTSRNICLSVKLKELESTARSWPSRS